MNYYLICLVGLMTLALIFFYNKIKSIPREKEDVITEDADDITDKTSEFLNNVEKNVIKSYIDTASTEAFMKEINDKSTALSEDIADIKNNVNFMIESLNNLIKKKKIEKVEKEV